MKIFISWSGDRSHKVADLLSTWIQCVLQAVEPWLSSKDIDRGSLWFSEITNQLSNTHNGIVCLTKSNCTNPWILFEAGALAKGLSSNRIYTFLIDMTPNDIKDPLAQFNHTLPNKASIFQLVRTINNGLENQRLKDDILSKVFETYWPQFEKVFTQIIDTTKEEEVKEERPKDDILNEILYSVRGFDRRLRKIEENEILDTIDEKVKKATVNSFYRPIEELDLNVRTYNFLKKMKVNNIDEFYRLNLQNPDLFIPNNIKEEIEMVLRKTAR